ncbi:PTS sugar transporter subunit IIC, partial [Klebsiella pneumoniae]|nr:PTS sugar transporter subunit IIC [Klebsiella pneumoniae]
MSKMTKVTQAFEQIAYKITSFKYIMAIKSAYITLMPVIIAGAFAVLMQNMVMRPETGLASFQPFRFLASLEPIMASINYATLNFITIGAVFLIGIELGKLNGYDSFFPGVMALMSYISVIPSTVLL